MRKAYTLAEKLIKKSKGCPCRLRGQKDSPQRAAGEACFDLLQTVPHEPECTINDYYILRCRRYGVIYKVSERKYHYPWWDWNRVDFD